MRNSISSIFVHFIVVVTIMHSIKCFSLHHHHVVSKFTGYRPRWQLGSNYETCRSYSKVMKATTTAAEGNTEQTLDNPDAMPENFKSPFLQTLLERGYIHQCTDFKTLDEKFTTTTVKAYLGFDATASSLHVGSLLQIMILRNLQKSGHKPIILIGGGTTKVGDPSGKDESRQLLTPEAIQKNADSIAQVFKKFIVFGDGPNDAMMVNNADWLDNINYLEFLRDYGRYFTINRMLSFESVKQRLARYLTPFTSKPICYPTRLVGCDRLPPFSSTSL